MLIGLAVWLGAPAVKDAKDKLPTLIGNWTVETAVLAGMPQPGVLAVISFTNAGTCTAKDSFGGEPDTLHYSVDLSESPGRLDLLAPGSKNAMLGICKFEKDALVICINMSGARPEKFVSTADSSVLLLTLKRSK